MYTYHTKNKGAAAARNYAMKKASGEYVCLLMQMTILMEIH